MEFSLRVAVYRTTAAPVFQITPGIVPKTLQAKKC
jgi:hypothetical protein